MPSGLSVLLAPWTLAWLVPSVGDHHPLRGLFLLAPPLPSLCLCGSGSACGPSTLVVAFAKLGPLPASTESGSFVGFGVNRRCSCMVGTQVRVRPLAFSRLTDDFAKGADVIDLCSCFLGCVRPGKMAVSLPPQKSYVGFWGHPPVPGAEKTGCMQRAVPQLHQHPLVNSGTPTSAPIP